MDCKLDQAIDIGGFEFIYDREKLARLRGFGGR